MTKFLTRPEAAKLLLQPCGLPHAIQRFGHANPVLCPVRVCCPAFPLVPGLGSTNSAASCLALFVSIIARMPKSDFSVSCISGYGSSPSSFGPFAPRDMANPEISRFPYKKLPYMPGSATTPG